MGAAAQVEERAAPVLPSAIAGLGALCHGGCPVRTFAARGTIPAKDPYGEVYEALFTRCRERAAETVRSPKAHLATAGART
jgi:hypothetical protein